MKPSLNNLQSYLSKFGSKKILGWVITLGVIAAYGLSETETSQYMENPYPPQGQYAPTMQSDPYAQPMPQPEQQPGLYQSGNQPFSSNGQQQPRMQPQSNGGYPNGANSNYPATAPAYPNSQGANYQQTTPANYGY